MQTHFLDAHKRHWEISQRYAHQENFSHKVVEPHRYGAEVVCGLIRQAELDGSVES